MNYFKLFFSKNSILRDFQNFEFDKIKIKGKCIEFGASENSKKNFLKNDKKFTICHFSNFKKKSNKIINIDLEKINNKINIKYDNAIIFNVLEHLNNVKMPLNNINRILKKDALIIGSTPFLYQVHGAPKDYYRFTKEFFLEKLKKNGFKKIKIKCLGYGPFVACFSILYSYIKYLPLITHIVLFMCYFIDFILQLFVKTKLNEIYPIGIFIVAKK